jgi:hypothetical protein
MREVDCVKSQGIFPLAEQAEVQTVQREDEKVSDLKPVLMQLEASS